MDASPPSTPGLQRSRHDVDVCIVGGGPAGLVLSLLLAGRGIRVLVLERHANFERDLRGEILQPRFTQIMRQIGLFDYVSQFPHERMSQTEFVIDGRTFMTVDFTRVAPDAPFMIWMTQPTLLNALHQKGAEFPSFEFWFRANVSDLLRDNGRITGVRVETDSQQVDVQAKIVIGADGRSSIVRKLMGAELEYELYNTDVLWFRLERPADYSEVCDLFVANDRSYLILPKHPNQLQCGILFRPGEFSDVKRRGIEEFKRVLSNAHPVFARFVSSVNDFTPFTLLQGKASFVREWAADGCLLIGDAAHTCSPAGGVGVSVAIATAIVAAERVCQALEQNDVSKAFLSRVQELRSAEIRALHKQQFSFTTMFVTRVTATRRFGPWVMPLLMRLGFLDRAARKLLTQPALPITMPLVVPASGGITAAQSS